MGFFGSSKEEPKPQVKPQQEENKPIFNDNDIIKTPVKDVSVIKNLLKVKADVEGGGSLIIGGVFEGDVRIEDTVFIEKGAKFSGTVRAKNVKVSVEFEGTIYATATEITNSGKFNGLINSNKTFLGGFVHGVIKSVDSIEILSSGIVEAKECKSKMIKIVGKLNGKVVASELLEIVSGGSVEGEIITKGIRTEQGGSVVGNIQTYDPSIHNIDTDYSSFEIKKEEPITLDPEVANLINIDPKDIQKYAKKEEDKTIKRVPPN